MKSRTSEVIRQISARVIELYLICIIKRWLITTTMRSLETVISETTVEFDIKQSENHFKNYMFILKQ